MSRFLCMSSTSLWNFDHRDQNRLPNMEDDDDSECYRVPPLMKSVLADMKASSYQKHIKWYYQAQPDHKPHGKTILPPAEMLPRNEALGGYIFVCNNETMQDDLLRQLFGLPPNYKDSVRAIIPGLPLFLYNYTTHQLHGVYQVRIRTKKNCKPLGEDAFRPILYHYDGPKFRLQLSVPEALALLDLFNEKEYTIREVLVLVQVTENLKAKRRRNDVGAEDIIKTKPTTYEQETKMIV